MLLQTNSYLVAKDRRADHARLMRRFKQSLARLGCDHFEVYEQVGPNWNNAKTTGRFVQIMRFRDRLHYQQVQAAERGDAAAQKLIQEFCDLVDFTGQQEKGTFAIGFYTSALPVARTHAPSVAAEEPVAAHADGEGSVDSADVPLEVVAESMQPADTIPVDESELFVVEDVPVDDDLFAEPKGTGPAAGQHGTGQTLSDMHQARQRSQRTPPPKS